MVLYIYQKNTEFLSVGNRIKEGNYMNISYVENGIVKAEDIANLRSLVGWNRMKKEYENPLMDSYYHIAVYSDNCLIGYIDSVSNKVTDAYIQDLMVHPDYQHMGIATNLMNRMIEYLKGNMIFMISVIYDKKLKPFYDKFGFNESLCGQMQTYEEE